MVGCLTASFPRRPGQHFKAHGLEHMYTSPMSLIDRCQKVAVEAHGPASFNRPYTVHDAIISYLQGLTNVYTFQQQPAMLYFKEAISILTTLGLHKTHQHTNVSNGLSTSSMGANGHHVDASRPPATDLVVQELVKRVFWVLYVGIKSLQQLGVSPFEIYLPPSTRSDPYPPLPTEIDDAYLTPTHMMQQPDGHISELAGFNANIKVFLTYDAVSLNDLIHGVSELVDWNRQKKELEQSLDNIKNLLEKLPPSLVLEHRQPINLSAQNSRYSDPESGSMVSAESQSTIIIATIEERMRMQQELQKMNVHANQLSTRSWLVEKYVTLRESHNSTIQGQPSPVDDAMAAEYFSITISFLLMLSTIQQNHLEPNGASLVSKLRAIVSALLNIYRTRKDSLPLKSEEHIYAFAVVLGKLQRAVGASEQRSDEEEEKQLRDWADFREVQARYIRDQQPSVKAS